MNITVRNNALTALAGIRPKQPINTAPIKAYLLNVLGCNEKPHYLTSSSLLTAIHAFRNGEPCSFVLTQTSNREPVILTSPIKGKPYQNIIVPHPRDYRS